jgi:signal transduction histidine kinase
LDPIRSIKMKLGLVVVVSGLAGLAYFWIGMGWITPGTSAVAIGLSLLTTQILAHGTTQPLREMTAAARAMARGDYTRRVKATSRDEVGELAHAFNQMSADLAAADQQRRELIANVSHELRTPITALQGVLENIVDRVTEPDPTTLRTALAQTERLGRLVTELLDLSRIDAGAHRLELTTFQLGPFVDEVVAEARVVVAAAGRVVLFGHSVQPPDCAILGDRDRLKQVVLNLLDNGVQHSPPGGEVLVTVRAHDAVVILDVSDEGPGIAAAERELVFERFTRGERATGGGTGLGLAIARWVVNLHGGTIAVADPDRAGPAPTVSSRPPGSGCLMRVVLPATAHYVPTRPLRRDEWSQACPPPVALSLSPPLWSLSRPGPSCAQADNLRLVTRSSVRSGPVRAGRLVRTSWSPLASPGWWRLRRWPGTARGWVGSSPDWSAPSRSAWSRCGIGRRTRRSGRGPRRCGCSGRCWPWRYSRRVAFAPRHGYGYCACSPLWCAARSPWLVVVPSGRSVWP